VSWIRAPLEEPPKKLSANALRRAKIRLSLILAEYQPTVIQAHDDTIPNRLYLL